MAAGRSNPSAGAARKPGAGREIELKLRLRAQDLPRLRARLESLGPSSTSHVDSTYYDTPDLRLAAAHAALRLRSMHRGGTVRWVQTFKTEDREAALSDRGEWETPAPRGRIDLARLAASPLPRLARRRRRFSATAPQYAAASRSNFWRACV